MPSICIVMINLAFSACNIVCFVNNLGTVPSVVSALSLFAAIFCGAVGIKILFEE